MENTPSIYDTRLAILREIANVLVDLADMDPTDDDFEEFVAAMEDAADIILEALGLDVVTIDADGIHAILRLGTGVPEDE